MVITPAFQKRKWLRLFVCLTTDTERYQSLLCLPPTTLTFKSTPRGQWQLYHRGVRTSRSLSQADVTIGTDPFRLLWLE